MFWKYNWGHKCVIQVDNIDTAVYLYLSMDHSAMHDSPDYAFAWNMEILAGSCDVAWQGYNKMDTADTPILKWDNC